MKSVCAKHQQAYETSDGCCSYCEPEIEAADKRLASEFVCGSVGCRHIGGLLHSDGRFTCNQCNLQQQGAPEGW